MLGKKAWIGVVGTWLVITAAAHGQASAFGRPYIDATYREDTVVAPAAVPAGLNERNIVQAQLLAGEKSAPPGADQKPPPAGLLPAPIVELFGDRKRSSDVLLPADTAKTPGFPNTRLTGFFQMDMAWFAQDTNSLNTFGNIQDDRGFRRARLAAVGDVAENVSYMLEMDFAFPGRPSFMDVWVELHKLPVLGNLRVGQYRVNFGMDELTSVRELQFLERGIVFGLAPFRQTAVGFHDANEEKTVTWAFDGFGYPSDFFGNSTGDRGYGFTTRITSLPYFDEESHHLIHLGVDYNCLDTSTGSFRFRNQAEYGGQFGPLNLGNTVVTNVPFFIDTGVLPGSTTQMVNGEFAFAAGSLYSQTEVRYAFVHLANGNFATLPTMYSQIGYFLTGEQRPYNKNNAVFGRVKPLRNFGDCGGIGAWEVAFRYSYANFHNNINPAFGNELTDTTLGLNWYLNQYTKFQFNWIHSFTNTGTGVLGNTDIYALRAQVDF